MSATEYNLGEYDSSGGWPERLERCLSLAATDCRFSGSWAPLARVPGLAQDGLNSLTGRANKEWFVDVAASNKLQTVQRNHETRNMHLSAVSEHSFSQHEARTPQSNVGPPYHPLLCF